MQTNIQAGKRRTVPTVLIVRFGRLRIHDAYLGMQLQSAGADVHFLAASAAGGGDVTDDVLQKIRCAGFPITLLTGGWFSWLCLRLGGVLRRLGLFLPPLYLNPPALTAARRILAERPGAIVVACEHFSLAFARRFCSSDTRLVYYSLEIFAADDPGVNPVLGRLLQEESSWLSGNSGELLIQDQARAAWLLRRNAPSIRPKVHHLPVFVPYEFHRPESSFLHQRLGLPGSRRIVLYFGDYFGEERRLDELLDEFSGLTDRTATLVLHGSRHFAALVRPEHTGVLASTERVPETQITELIASCWIGIAFYDNTRANTRLTAFSSEKITRYLQCGKPFVAFRNETTETLRSRFRCCELVDRISELGTAITAIAKDYQSYRSACEAAYESIFSPATIQETLRQMLSDPQPDAACASSVGLGN